MVSSTVKEKPIMICKLADDTSSCIFGKCPTFGVCFPKPCGNCNVSIKQAMDNDEVTCCHTCPEWNLWSRLR